MKKLAWQLILPLFILFFIGCDNNDTKTNVATSDSTANVIKTDSSNLPVYDSTQVQYWEIDSLTADAMIKNTGSSGHPSHVKYGRKLLMQSLRDSFGASNVRLISARYRAEDVTRYREKRGFSATDSAGMVTQYFTKIVEVRIRLNAAQASPPVYDYMYFDLVTICPPPDDGSCGTIDDSK